jgi:aspartate aminotransferase
LFKELSEITSLKTANAKGAFYLFPDVKFFFGKSYNGVKIGNSFDLSMYLISEAKVVTIPGTVFGIEGFIRIAYATSMENLKEGVLRIKEALNKLK